MSTRCIRRISSSLRKRPAKRKAGQRRTHRHSGFLARTRARPASRNASRAPQRINTQSRFAGHIGEVPGRRDCDRSPTALECAAIRHLPRPRRARLILYEYPFNERIRTLLRLEDLFERFTFFLTQEDAREHHVALTTLIEIAEVAGRTDLKADLMKELERQRQTLAPFRGNPGIEQEALEAVLGEIEQ